MQKDQFEYLQGLLMDAFTASCRVLERDLQKSEPKASIETIRAEIQKEYPLAELMDKPDDLKAAIGLMAVQGIFPPEDGIDATEFFSGLIHMIDGPDKQRANECAGRVMLILSENYRQMIGTPTNGPAFN